MTDEDDPSSVGSSAIVLTVIARFPIFSSKNITQPSNQPFVRVSPSLLLPLSFLSYNYPPYFFSFHTPRDFLQFSYSFYPRFLSLLHN